MKLTRERVIEVLKKYIPLIGLPSDTFETIASELCPEPDKTAEEILAPYIRTIEEDDQYPFPYIRPSCALLAMEEYARQRHERREDR